MYSNIVQEIIPEDAQMLLYFMNNATLLSLTTLAILDQKVLVSEETGYYSNRCQYYSCPADQKEVNKIIGVEHAFQNLIRLGIVTKISKHLKNDELHNVLYMKKNRLHPLIGMNKKYTLSEKINLHMFGYNIACARSLSRHINNINSILSKNKKCHLEHMVISMEMYGLTSFGYEFLQYISKDKMKHRSFLSDFY